MASGRCSRNRSDCEASGRQARSSIPAGATGPCPNQYARAAYPARAAPTSSGSDYPWYAEVRRAEEI
jgi:hypothetical protein